MPAGSGGRLECGRLAGAKRDRTVNADFPVFARAECPQRGFIDKQDNDGPGLRALLKADGGCGGAVVIDGLAAHTQGAFAVLAAASRFVGLWKDQHALGDVQIGPGAADLLEAGQRLVDFAIDFFDAGGVCWRLGQGCQEDERQA